MKTINEIKDEVAQKHGYKNWADALYVWKFGFKTFSLSSLENEATIAYAKMAIEEQKRLCYEKIPFGSVYKEYREDVKNSILNAPNVELK